MRNTAINLIYSPGGCLSMRVMHVSPEVSLASPSDLIAQNEKFELTHVLLRQAKTGDPAACIVEENTSEIIVGGVHKVLDHSYDEKLRKIFDELFKKYKPEIVHIHVYSGFSLLPILNAASSLDIKKVLTLHDHSLIHNKRSNNGQAMKKSPGSSQNRPGRSSSGRSQVFYTRAKHIFDQCDVVVCPSQAQRSLLERVFGENEKIVFTEALDLKMGTIYKKAFHIKKRMLYLKLGHLCNSKCLYCVAGVVGQPFIDLRLLKKELEKNAADYGRVILTGGEPTMHPRFFDLLTIAYYLGYKITIQSNIRAFSGKKFTAKAKKFNVKIIVCMNSSREQVFDVMADAPGAFRQTVEGIKNLTSQEIEVETKIIITNQNRDHLTEVVRFIKGFGIKAVMLVFPTPMGLALENFKLINPRYGDILPSVHNALQWGIDNNMRMSTENIPGCQLDEKYHKYNSEYENQGILDGIYLNSDKGLYNCKMERMDVQKIKVRGCTHCQHSYKCEGVYREYVRHFGETEFNPVTAKG